MANEQLMWQGVPDISSFDSIYNLNKHLSVKEFQETYEEKYIERVSYDVKQSKFYDQFNDFTIRPDSKPEVMQNYNLKKDELPLFEKNGFVVREQSKRTTNFANEYLTIYNNDLPVFITADSILHAFHKSYDTIMTSVERSHLSDTLEQLLRGLSNNLVALHNELDETGPLIECCKDVDVFLTTALSLLTGKTSTPVFPSTNISPFLEGIKTYKALDIEFCGKERKVDFSKFRPIARYQLAGLENYFHAMMWCALDFEIGGDEMNARELGASLILYFLLQSSSNNASPPANSDSDSSNFSSLFNNKQENQSINLELQWNQMNSFLESLVGFSNCVNFVQLGHILQSACKFKKINDLNNVEVLSVLHDVILQNEHLARKYNSKEDSSRVFAFLGRRFTIDNWATSKLTGKFIQENNQRRRRTSGVDTAFSVLRNNAASSILADRINDTSATNFRDGVPIQANLEALRKVIDDIPQETWQSSLYMNWLDAIRTLSGPFDERVPQAMKTKAYAMKTMNTQLGSWAELRHDNVLYVDEDSDDDMGCSYPEAYVEPIPQFFEAMETLTRRLACTVEAATFPARSKSYRYQDPQELQKGIIAFYNNFSQQMSTLKEIAVAQLNSIELTEMQQKVLKSVTTLDENFCGLGEMDGWYYRLFFYSPAMETDSSITGVFSAKPIDEYTDPGSVLHAGVSNHKLMLICVEKGNNVVMYAGPVYNCKELDLPYGTRLNDDEWVLLQSKIPPPDWTSAYQCDKIPESTVQNSIEKVKQQFANKKTAQPFSFNHNPVQQAPIEEEEVEYMATSFFE